MKYIEKIFEELNIDSPETKIQKLEKYREGILEWNNKVNITKITTKEGFEIKHYADSLAVAFSPEFQASERVLDMGTGGGFPGIPLAVAYPEKEFVLVDSLAKRLKIVAELAKSCGITNVNIIHGRAEELAGKEEYRETFDFCVSRAVANMSTLAEYCLPYIKVGGIFAAYKGPEEDISGASKALAILGGRILREDAPGIMRDLQFEHRIIYIVKEAKTPAKYPRRAPTPSKSPL